MTHVVDEENYLAHYGILRRSGRYPWGSGGNSEQRSRSFLDYIKELLGFGLTYPEIAKGVGMTTTQLRETNSLAKAALKQAEIAWATRLREHGNSHQAIAEIMGVSGESYVRSLLKPGEMEKANIVETVSNSLRDQMEQKGYLDVGTGVERHLGISKEKLNTALAILRDEGYEVITVPVEQLGTGHLTKVKVLAPPGTSYQDIKSNTEKIGSVFEWSEDGGETMLGIHPPLSVDSKRVGINYAEDGGIDADGVIYVRPGIDDISLDGGQYAQVRIAVDGTHYLKGMAIYKDDLPAGVDLVFNTNKSKLDVESKLDAMKPLKTDSDGNIDPDNPFGSAISRQVFKKDQYGVELRDANGQPIVSSAMNLVNEAGKWESWSKDLSSQMLSKQPPPFAKQQLNKTFESKQKTLDEIMELTNPAVKKKLLDAFADETDSAAFLLQAASLPRTANYVILPVNTLKPTEVFAPKFRDGEKVVLIRHPHGGKFEIPELQVNNRHPAAKKLIGVDAPDAIGINAKVAEQLSGADFDGDTVLVVPNNSGSIKTAPALEQLKSFTPRDTYRAYEGMPRMSPSAKGHQMGLVSNLITDMTIQKANTDEIARAVKHSMVVIDAEKHHLNYKQSAIDHGIPQLMKKYQPKPNSRAGGASTLVSRRKQEIDVPERIPRPASKGGPIDPKTGKKVYEYTDATYVDPKTGRTITKTSKARRVLEVDDVREMSSGTVIEEVYANHSNKLKSLANEARRASVNTRDISYSPSARKAYDAEVKQLNAKLNVALKNRPRERQAQLIANTTYKAKRAANPDMDHSEEKKLKAQALEAARARVNAGKKRIQFEPREWEAIQAGAITKSKLKDILDNADLDEVKKLATPKVAPAMSSSKIAKAKRLAASGKTQAEIADALGVGLTTLKEGLK